MKKGILTYLSVWITVLSFGQIHVDSALIFTNPIPTERQVFGVAQPVSGTDAANAKSIQSGSLIFVNSASPDTLLVNLSPSILTYTQGMQINLRLDTNNRGALYLDINGLGAVAITKSLTQQLDSNDLVKFEMFSVIYDGTNFQLISTYHLKCPMGYTQINEDYCIETDDHPADHFWNALTTCKNLGGNLCSYPDWYYACQNTAFGLLNMTNNWEWVNDAHDHAYTASRVGNPDCKTFVTTYVFTTYLNNYRCCYYIKR